MGDRTAEITRETKETKIRLKLGIDGGGNTSISTGVGFLDHMLELLAKHALMDLEIEATGDRQVDDHHTVEDVGICLGLALKEALGDKRGITRFGDVSVPMQEALANVALDISGRPALVFNVNFNTPKIGSFDAALAEEFLEGFVANGGVNLHVNVPYGKNDHHIAEAVFKGLAKALRKATALDDRATGVPSTKGVL